MKISLVQSDIIWEDRRANLANLDLMMSRLPALTDLVILPEMFTTGFSMDPENICEEPGGETFLWMKNKAREGNFGLCGSYIIVEGGKFYNRLVFITSEGAMHTYDKRHLFGLGGEKQNFTNGSERIVFIFRGFRICPLICYDLRFPVWSRNRNDYDLLIYSSNWPKARHKAWNTLVMARAIENQCFVAAVNRVGRDGNNTGYMGESVLIDYTGEPVISAGKGTAVVVTGEISMESLTDYRSKFPFLSDADRFAIFT